MEYLIGVTPDDSGRDAMALGSLLCRAFDATPVLAYVHPRPLTSAGGGDPADLDPEYLEVSQRVLADAKVHMELTLDWDDVETVLGGHKSSGKGLDQLAQERSSDAIIIGSAPHGAPGRFQIGSTANQLLHGGHKAVAVAPAGYRETFPDKIGNVVVAFQSTGDSKRRLQLGATWAERVGAKFSILTIMVRQRMMSGRFGPSGETLIDQLERTTEADQRKALANINYDGEPEYLISISETARKALNRLDWSGDEFLLLGSASGGPVSRVFLGDMTYKLLRAAPVPAVILPHHATS